MKTQYKVIGFYKDAPELCGEISRLEPNGNLYSYEQAIEMIKSQPNQDIYGFRLEELETA